MNIVARLKGDELLGMKVDAPLSIYTDGVYALPMMNIKPNKGTGVVTSVPSDSPDDFVSLRDLKNKKAFREKYGLTDEMVLPFEPIEIIKTPNYGNLAAQTVVESMKIASQNDREKLEQAKEAVYKCGFYEGVLLKGEYKGQQIQEVKKKLQTDLLNKKSAVVYYEPEKEVVSRSGDIAVVALCDQWFLDYGDARWKSQASDALAKLNVIEEARHNFKATLSWMQEHACSRTYGLGSHLPWDEEWLIESLSDSTIYMAYYTVSHILQPDSFDGSKVGTFGIKPEDMTPAVWDYIFLGEGDPQKLSTSKSDLGLSVKNLKRMKTEFNYWYPVDLRVSGKDLIPNHLTYYLYNHTAIWPNQPELWPQEIRANGHLQLNSEKMSKSTGNFLTLRDAIDKYSADGIRLALADAGDTLEDANLEESMCEAGFLRLYNLIDWVKETVSLLEENSGEFRTTGPLYHADKVMVNEINRTIELSDHAYSEHLFREVVKLVFYELQAHRDRYKEVCGQAAIGVHADILRRYVEVQCILLSPICPHTMQHLWQSLSWLKSSKLVCDAPWPQLTAPVDTKIHNEGRFVDTYAHKCRLQLRSFHTIDSKTKGKKDETPSSVNKGPIEAVIWIADGYPEWQMTILKLMKGNIKSDGVLPENSEIAAALKPQMKALGKNAKKAMPFVQFVRDKCQSGLINLNELQSEIDESSLFDANLDYMRMTLGLSALKVKSVSECETEKVRDSVCPMEPVIIFTRSVQSTVELRNLDVSSGLFGCAGFAISDQETADTVASRILHHFRQSSPAAKNVKSLKLRRYKNNDCARKMPPLDASDIIDLSGSDVFNVNPNNPGEILVIDSSGSKHPVGDVLVYAACF